MQYSPKLKKAMQEIKAIISKYDIAASVVIHTPGHSEVLLKIDPTYSCAKIEGDSVIIKATSSEIPDKNIRHKRIEDTSNMLLMLAQVTGETSLQLWKLSEVLDNETNPKHGNKKFTSHNTQNN